MVGISDARMSGTAFGTIVRHIMPKSAVGGPLALVQTGDRIRIIVPQRNLELLVDATELARRAQNWRPTQPPNASRGYAYLFHQSVLQVDQGCDFDFLVGTRPSV